MGYEAFSAALNLAADPVGILIMLGATFLGMVIGALPGLGTVTALAMVLPFTFILSPAHAIGMLLAIYVSSVFGGAIPAILINVPGTPQSAATSFEGYPMAQRGDAPKALGWVTVGSAFGGIFSAIILMVAAPQLAALSLKFGVVETFALIVFSLTTIAWVSAGNPLKGLLAGVIGLTLSTVGIDEMSGTARYTFGNFALTAGFHVVPILIGLFALSEVFATAGRTATSSVQEIAKAGFKIAPFREWWALKLTLLRSSAIGTFLGILPGVGATAASLIAYAQAKAASENQDNFGSGEPDGLIASESANNAVTGGALVPTLALGIPGDAATAVMLGALIIHGITPGVELFTRNGELVSFIFIALFIVNIMMLVVGAFTSQLFTRILKLPHALIMGGVVALALAGSYVIRTSILDVWMAICAGFAGLLFRYCNVPLAPIVIGFILGPTLEKSLRQSLILTQNNPVEFFQSPIASFFFTITAIVVFWPLLMTFLRKKKSEP